VLDGLSTISIRNLTYIILAQGTVVYQPAYTRIQAIHAHAYAIDTCKHMHNLTACNYAAPNGSVTRLCMLIFWRWQWSLRVTSLHTPSMLQFTQPQQMHLP
jgi:hypothetical protein